MNCEQFRFSATIDWIDVRVTLKKATNFQTVQRKFPSLTVEKPFVKPCAPDSKNNTTAVFTIRIQDPTSPASVQRQLDQLSEQLPFTAPAHITGVEVSLDAFLGVEAYRGDLLGEMAVQLFNSHAKLVGDWRVLGRIGSMGEVRHPTTLQELRAAMVRDGLTVFVGGKDADITQRFYFKRTDGSAKATELHRFLPESEHRARCEVTLRNSACPFRIIEEWQSFKFERLSKYFKFRSLKALGSDPTSFDTIRHRMRSTMVRLSPDSGNPRDAEKVSKLLKEHRRTSDPNREADTELNDRSYDALRGLTMRYQLRATSELT